MPTIQQLIRTERKTLKTKTKSPALRGLQKEEEYVLGITPQLLKNLTRPFEK